MTLDNILHKVDGEEQLMAYCCMFCNKVKDLSGEYVLVSKEYIELISENHKLSHTICPYCKKIEEGKLIKELEKMGRYAPRIKRT